MSWVVKVSSGSFQNTFFQINFLFFLRVFELCHNQSFWVLSQVKFFLSFFLKFFSYFSLHNCNFLDLLKYDYLSFILIWFFDFCPNQSFIHLSQSDYYYFCSHNVLSLFIFVSSSEFELLTFVKVEFLFSLLKYSHCWLSQLDLFLYQFCEHLNFGVFF